jgi:hypothetical protein
MSRRRWASDGIFLEKLQLKTELYDSPRLSCPLWHTIGAVSVKEQVEVRGVRDTRTAFEYTPFFQASTPRVIRFVILTLHCSYTSTCTEIIRVVFESQPTGTVQYGVEIAQTGLFDVLRVSMGRCGAATKGFSHAVAVGGV